MTRMIHLSLLVALAGLAGCSTLPSDAPGLVAGDEIAAAAPARLSFSRVSPLLGVDRHRLVLTGEADPSSELWQLLCVAEASPAFVERVEELLLDGSHSVDPADHAWLEDNVWVMISVGGQDIVLNPPLARLRDGRLRELPDQASTELTLEFDAYLIVTGCSDVWEGDADWFRRNMISIGLTDTEADARIARWARIAEAQ